MGYCAIVPLAVPNAAHWHYIRALKTAGISHIIAVESPGSPDEQEGGVFAAGIRPAVDGYHAIPAAKGMGVGGAIKAALAHYAAHAAGYGTKGVFIDCFAALSACGMADLCRESERRPNSLVYVKRERGGFFFSAAMRVLCKQALPRLYVFAAAVPNALVGVCQKAAGTSSGFMLNMAILCAGAGVPIATIPAQRMEKPLRGRLATRTMADRLVYFYTFTGSLLRFVANAALSGGLDFAVYALMARFALVFLPDTTRLFLSSLTARIASSSVNYALNRRLPFVTNNRLAPTILKYYTLWAIQLGLSFSLVWALHTAFGLSELIAKLCVDPVLGFFSYQIQMRWVFTQKPTHTTDFSYKQEG